MVSRIIYGVIWIVIGFICASIIDFILRKVLKNFKKDKSILIFFYIRVSVDVIVMILTYSNSFILLGVTSGLFIERIIYMISILYRQKIEKRCIN